MTVKPIPDGYETVTPYLMARSPDAVISFLEQAFDASVKTRVNAPDGRLLNAELQVGTSMIMIGQPPSIEDACPCAFYIYVEDADAVYARALAAGGSSIMEPADMPYGDRHGGVSDPDGNSWWIATHIEDVSSEEVERRMKPILEG